jgi:hypothetical protein
MAVLGMETSSGDFEVIDLCFAGLPDLYTPTVGSSSNGKGKGKGKDESDDMQVDGTFFELWKAKPHLTRSGGVGLNKTSNGKGKGKAKDESTNMQVDGTFFAL